MKKHRNIDFTRKTIKHSPLLLVFMICVLVITAGGISFAVLLSKNNYDFQKFFGTRNAETTTEDINESFSFNSDVDSENTAIEIEDTFNLLFLCYDDDKSITFSSVVSFLLNENTVKIKPLSPDLSLDFHDGNYSLNELFSAFSVGAVCDGLENKGIDIKRYVCADETGLKMLLQKLGAVTVTLEHDVAFKVDAITYTWSAGEQEMTADAFLKFIKYSSEGEELLKVQGECISALLRCHFTAANLNKGETFFASLINLTTTDITAFDYTEYKSYLIDFFEGSPKFSVIC